MIEGLGMVVRGLHAACTLVGFGTLLCLHLPARKSWPAVAVWRGRWLRIALALSAAALLLGVGVGALQVTALDSDLPWQTVAPRLLLESRFGAVWGARQALMLAACVLLITAVGKARGPAAPGLALIATGAALAIAPLSGHSAAQEPAWPALTAHAMHLLAAGAWWGALPALAALVLGSSAVRNPAVAARTFQRFSTLALWLMLLLAASGVWLALTHVARWPALLATRYGHLVMLKTVLLSVVLAMAAQLRWRWLPALLNAGDGRIAGRSGQWILAECLVASAIVLAATQLGQTVPARHDAIDWWLPWRLSIDATWDTRFTPLRAWSGLALLGCAALLAALALLGRERRGRALFGALALTVCAAAVALPVISVPAYPDTYRKPSVPYQTISVAAGASLFATHCARCHGRSGHGDGEQAKTLPLPPADLTEPHTALHTAGDIFWWLTHGKPPGVMPGFPGTLSEDERWDLINFVRTLSAGYQARIIGERIVPQRPWLPAVDFAYGTAGGQTGTLKDFRGRSAVLLVHFRGTQSKARMAQLSAIQEQLRATGVEVLAVPIDDAGARSGLPLPVVTEGAEETARAYALFRRTLSDADPRDERPLPGHLELLIDRFGYVRARWIPGTDEGWRDVAVLLQEAALLAREKQILPPPEDHVH